MTEEQLNIEHQTSDEEQADISAESVTEAVLFASDAPLSAERLAKIVETSVKQVR